jgi:hypothetical protein
MCILHMGLAVSVQQHTWGLVKVCSSTHGACCFSNKPLAAVPVIYCLVFCLPLLLAFFASSSMLSDDVPSFTFTQSVQRNDQEEHP